jgi:hypothetical protein
MSMHPGRMARAAIHDQVLDDEDDRGTEDDDEQRREDAADEREQHLDRRLGGLLLGALATLDPELLGLDLEHLRDRDAELLRLDDRADEVGERLDLGPRDDVAQRVAPRLADPDLREGTPELVDQGALHLLDDLAERGVEAEAGANGDREEIEGVRDADQDLLLAGLDPPAEPELRPDVADPEADETQQHAHHEVLAEDPDEQEEERPDAGRGDRLDPEPVADPHVAGVAGHREAFLGSLRERARSDPRHRARQAGGERLHGPVEERLLELELLEVLRGHRPELVEAGPERVLATGAGDAEDDEHDGDRRDGADDEGERHRARPRYPRSCEWPGSR